MDRINDLDMSLCLLLSDMWGYGPNNPPGENGDWTDWEEFVTCKVQELLSLENADPDKISVSPWNEASSGLPEYDNHQFWKFTGPYSFENHFMDTWKHAYDAIKNVHSDLKVMGPEFSGYYANDLKDHFLIPARDMNAVPDILNWHFPYGDLVNQIDNITGFMNANNISVEGIAIGEYSNQYYRYYGNFGFFVAEMERASIITDDNIPFVQAYFAPWGHGLIGGTVSYGTGNEGGYKRGGWWVLKKYADMDGNDALKTTKGQDVGGYSTYKDDTLKILLGTFTKPKENVEPKEPEDPYSGNTLINLEGFNPVNSPVPYRVYQLTLNKDPDNPNTSGEQGPPAIVDSGTLEPEADGTIPLAIDWEHYYDCYYIEVDITTAPPPLSVYIYGPFEVHPYETGVWTANPSGGTPPYQYSWDWRRKYGNAGSPWTSWSFINPLKKFEFYWDPVSEPNLWAMQIFGPCN